MIFAPRIVTLDLNAARDNYLVEFKGNFVCVSDASGVYAHVRVRFDSPNGEEFVLKKQRKISTFVPFKRLYISNAAQGANVFVTLLVVYSPGFDFADTSRADPIYANVIDPSQLGGLWGQVVLAAGVSGDVVTLTVPTQPNYDPKIALVHVENIGANPAFYHWSPSNPAVATEKQLTAGKDREWLVKGPVFGPVKLQMISTLGTSVSFSVEYLRNL